MRAEIDTVLPVERAARAQELGEAGRSNGKIILDIATGEDAPSPSKEPRGY
jgi:hypothetical protein